MFSHETILDPTLYQKYKTKNASILDNLLKEVEQLSKYQSENVLFLSPTELLQLRKQSLNKPSTQKPSVKQQQFQSKPFIVYLKEKSYRNGLCILRIDDDSVSPDEKQRLLNDKKKRLERMRRRRLSKWRIENADKMPELEEKVYQLDKKEETQQNQGENLFSDSIETEEQLKGDTKQNPSLQKTKSMKNLSVRGSLAFLAFGKKRDSSSSSSLGQSQLKPRASFMWFNKKKETK